MTGFARTNGHLGALSWVWETRSVNSKGLDIRLRLPPGFEHLD
ncbi:MAG: YicC/YloC family endoribonuclease, partial [Pseudomonadota bacterium]